MTVRDADILIAGGGMVGLSLGLALKQAGLEVLVADAAPPDERVAETYDGRASAISYSSYRMWRALGLEESLAPHAEPISRILVTDGQSASAPSWATLAFDRRELDEREEGEALGVMIENRRIRLALHEGAAKSGLRLLAPAAITGYRADEAGVTATLADSASAPGQTLRAGLIIGAEGRKSAVRAAAGIRTFGWSYNETAIVCSVAHEKPHEGVAHEFFQPAGPFAMLPLTNNRCNIVWAERPHVAKALLALPDADFLAELKLRFGDHLGPLRLAGPRFSYPLSLQIAERFIAPRMALAGDAAHGVHPIAGQGLNIGLRDVAALAECLSDGAALGLDAGDAAPLERYQKWRRFDVLTNAFVMDGFDRLFSNDFAFLRRWRGRGMALVDALPFARKFFMREAAGDTGALPRLLRGESLAA